MGQEDLEDNFIKDLKKVFNKYNAELVDRPDCFTGMSTRISINGEDTFLSINDIIPSSED